MCRNYSPFEGIHIGACPASNSGILVYYDCIPSGKTTKWAYIITVDGNEYSVHTGIFDASMNRTELETALQAFHGLPDNADNISVYTPCSFLYGTLYGLAGDNPKQFKKLFAELFKLIKHTHAKLYCRTGSWGDEYAAKCHALAESAEGDAYAD